MLNDSYTDKSSVMTEKTNTMDKIVLSNTLDLLMVYIDQTKNESPKVSISLPERPTIPTTLPPFGST